MKRKVVVGRMMDGLIAVVAFAGSEKKRRGGKWPVDRLGSAAYISVTPAAGPEVSRLCGLVFPICNMVSRFGR